MEDEEDLRLRPDCLGDPSSTLAAEEEDEVEQHRITMNGQILRIRKGLFALEVAKRSSCFSFNGCSTTSIFPLLLLFGVIQSQLPNETLTFITVLGLLSFIDRGN